MTASRRKTLSPWNSSTWQPWFCSVLKSRSARILSYFKRRDNKTGQKQHCQACENGLFFAQNQKKRFARLFACEKRRKLRAAERKRLCTFREVPCVLQLTDSVLCVFNKELRLFSNSPVCFANTFRTCRYNRKKTSITFGLFFWTMVSFLFSAKPRTARSVVARVERRRSRGAETKRRDEISGT